MDESDKRIKNRYAQTVEWYKRDILSSDTVTYLLVHGCAGVDLSNIKISIHRQHRMTLETPTMARSVLIFAILSEFCAHACICDY